MWHQAALRHELEALTSLPAQLEQAPARQEKGRSRPAPQGKPAQPGVRCKACRASGASTLGCRAGQCLRFRDCHPGNNVLLPPLPEHTASPAS